MWREGYEIMSNYYTHDRLEEKIKRDLHDRPTMPKPSVYVNHEMRRYLLRRKLSYSLARENGWYGSRAVDGYDRIVIPCSNSFGVPYYQARAIDDWASIRYNSPKATREDSVVLVWPRKTQQPHGTVLVEGPTDALAAAMLGFLGIGLMGNEPPEAVINFIVRIVKDSYEPVFVIPDRDHVEMGAFMTGTLSTHEIKASMRIPKSKDLAGMKLWERELLVA